MKGLRSVLVSTLGYKLNDLFVRFNVGCYSVILTFENLGYGPIQTSGYAIFL